MKNQAELDTLLTTAGAAGGLSLLMAVFRTVLAEKHGGWKPFLRGVVSSVIVGVLVGWGLEGSFAKGLEWTIIAICAYVADDILAGLMVIAALFRRDPFAFLSRIINSLRAKGDKP